MKKAIIITLCFIVVCSIIILHDKYKEDNIISGLYIIVRILAVIGIIKFIINKRKQTT
jgi:D-alanyl-lipoteichoic acid acyltransferase DltB (MBOAT superfamily)